MQIRPLNATPDVRAQLAQITIEAVAQGALLGFLHPLTLERAEAFWGTFLQGSEQGRCVVLGAWDGEVLAGTVTLMLDLGENKLHRGDILKLITRASHRGRGVATALMDAAERLAVERGRIILTLGTAVEGGASALYEARGYSLGGVMPDILGKPRGGLTGQMLYWKRIG